VLWEFQTAQVKPGLNAILPMPLEDPAIAPLPPGDGYGTWHNNLINLGIRSSVFG
jgi:hypothetical protein